MKHLLLIILIAAFAIGCSAQNLASSNSLYSSSIKKTVKSYSQKIGLADLEKSKLGNTEIEIRIWVGFGTFEPRFFVLKQAKDKDLAFYSNSISRIKQLLETPLPEPKSGWNSLRAYLFEQNVILSKKPYPQKDKFGDPDEESVAIEIKTKSGYLFATYLLSTVNIRGKKVLEICKKIEEEFPTVKLVH